MDYIQPKKKKKKLKRTHGEKLDSNWNPIKNLIGFKLFNFYTL